MNGDGERVYEATQANFRAALLAIKESGISGYDIVEVPALEALNTPGDRATFKTSGTKIIVPPSFAIADMPQYNVNVNFGICLNEDGENSDNWFDFEIQAAVGYANIWPRIENVMFEKLTVRNYQNTKTADIRFWVFQDPFFIYQINQMYKDITP